MYDEEKLRRSTRSTRSGFYKTPLKSMECHLLTFFSPRDLGKIYAFTTKTK